MADAEASASPVADRIRLPPCSPDLRRTLITASLWFVLSMSLTYYNSWLLQDPLQTGGEGHPGFAFPFLYTTVQMCGQCLSIAIVFQFLPTSLYEQLPTWRQMCDELHMWTVLALVRFTQIGIENTALMTVSLTFNESVKSMVPLFVMGLAIAFEGRSYEWPLALAVGGLSVGASMVAIGSSENAGTSNSISGMILTGLATVASAVNPVVAAMLMRKKANNPLVLTFVEASLSIPVYLVAWLVVEREESVAFLVAHPAESACYLLAGSAMATMYCIVVFQLIHTTSSLTSTVFGSAKHLLMVLIGAYAVDNVRSVMANVGMAIFGPSLVAYVCLTALGRKGKRELPPSSSAQRRPDETTALKSADQQRASHGTCTPAAAVSDAPLEDA